MVKKKKKNPPPHQKNHHFNNQVYSRCVMQIVNIAKIIKAFFQVFYIFIKSYNNSNNYINIL